MGVVGGTLSSNALAKNSGKKSGKIVVFTVRIKRDKGKIQKEKKKSNLAIDGERHERGMV